ncbi:MAG TPA: thioredoxin domain-containing protein [Candidatus Binatia bacterium]|nr:thioredoxin domain-containing protein [Candidatus Binatia bacterium]
MGWTQSKAIPPDVIARIQHQLQAYYQLPPEVNIALGTPAPSEFAGYDLLPVTLSAREKTKKIDFLVSHDGKTLIQFTKLDLTKDIYAETMNKISLADRPVRGNPAAKVTIVNFDDFECPFCARMHSTLMGEILPQYGDRVRIVYKDYPLLQIHPWAEHAANDANCLAHESGAAYWKLADYLHANQRAIGGPQKGGQTPDSELDRLTMDFGRKNGADLGRLQACVKTQSDAAVKASIAEGDKLGVSATPTLFINGERLEGALDADEVKTALNRQLLAAGVQLPGAAVAPQHQQPASK